jgi:hypothetical protein
MKHTLAIALYFVAFCSSAAAQFTTVTGTVVDPNGLPYAGGTIASTIASSGTPTLTISGVTVN